MEHLQIITTADGSHSLLNTALNETYHSQHGALQESNHVFIDHGLRFFHVRYNPQAIRVFEVGFGTGLNAWLALQYSEKTGVSIDYTTLETSPLPEAVWSKLNYATTADGRNHFTGIHSAAWDGAAAITGQFTLRKISASLQEFSAHAKFDVVFFDAFAPSKQPEMWEIDLLRKVVGWLDAPGVFVTYCAKGQVKRDLRSLGTSVETLAGPPGKREMVRAMKGG